SIPASFRRVIETSDPDWTEGLRPTFSIAYGEDERPYLEGYSVAALEELHGKIDMMPPGSPAREVMEDLYYSRVQEFQIDDDGRIVLPASLRDKIGLTGEASFVAKGNRFEIWAPEAYKSRRASRTSEFLREQGADFNPHALLQSVTGQS
ncbi:cell division/cell wall cluster transcriptional repressor MraZ, partial [Thioclava sp. BHET1]